MGGSIIEASELSKRDLGYDHPNLEYSAYVLIRRHIAEISSAEKACSLFGMKSSQVKAIESGARDPSYLYRLGIAKHCNLNMGGLASLVWSTVKLLRTIDEQSLREVLYSLTVGCGVRCDKANFILNTMFENYMKIGETMSHVYSKTTGE